jgi:hypothetical protein
MPTSATSQTAVRTRPGQTEPAPDRSPDRTAPSAPGLAGTADDRRFPRSNLLGRDHRFFRHADRSAAALLDLVRSHSLDGRATDPMIAWTDGPDGDGPDRARDAYRVLGWTSTDILRGTLSRRLDSLNPVAAFRLLDQPEIAVLEQSHRDYVVLRGLPYRNGETAGPSVGAIWAHDIDFWHTTDAGEVEGVFAIDVNTFRDRFIATGIAA